MILAAGATLQSGKYVIQAVLHQTDLGVTYQAYHVYLDQTVVLQTLNPNAQRLNNPQVRHQFMEGARHLAKYPSNHRLRAIDLFEEQVELQNSSRDSSAQQSSPKQPLKQPFVVLTFFPNQQPQKLGEWFAYLPEPTLADPVSRQAALPQETPKPTSKTAPNAPQPSPESPQKASIAPNPEFIQSTVQAAPSANGADGKAIDSKAIDSKTTDSKAIDSKAKNGSGDRAKNGAANPTFYAAANGGTNGATNGAANGTTNGAANGTTNGTANGAVPVPTPLIAPAAETSPYSAPVSESHQKNGGRSLQPTNSKSVRVLVQPKSRWSNAFLLTALIAGATGAGMGFALRSQPAGTQGKTPFNLGTNLFTREQSFPAEGNWPIQETPAAAMPEPAANQPVYSGESALRYTPPIEPFPASRYVPQPAAPDYSAPDVPVPASASRNSPAETSPEVEKPRNLPPAYNPIPPLRQQAAQPPAPAPVAPAPSVIDPPAPAPVAPAPSVIDPPPAPAPAASAPKPSSDRPPRPRGIDQ